MKKLAVLTLGVLSSVTMMMPASAADYYVVGGTHQALVVVEASSVLKESDTVRSFVLLIFRRAGENQKATGRAYGHEMREYHCAAQQSRWLSTIYFGADHKELGAVQEISAWRAVESGSMDAATFEALCKRDLAKEPTLLRGLSQSAMAKFGADYLEEKLAGQ